jgi:uncharacterized protein (DUF58 family)
MGQRRVVVQLTPLGRRVGLLALSLLPLAVIGGALDELRGLPTRPGAGALVFLGLLALAALAYSRWSARSGLAGLEVRAREPVCGDEGELVLLPLELVHTGRGRSLRDLELLAGHARSGVARTIGFATELAPQSTLRASCSWRLARRGHWRELRLSVASAWPLGLAEGRVEFVLEADVLALPRRLAPGLLPAQRPAGHGSHEARRRRARGQADLRDLRRWREGEDQRLVHWKVSARTGRLVLRELQGEERGVLRLFLVLRRGSGTREGFEQAVRVVATLARDALALHPEVRTAAIGATRREAPAVTRAGELHDLFAFLAQVEACDESAADLGALAREALARGELPLFVHAACGMALPAENGAAAIDAQTLEVDAPQTHGVGA